MINEQALKDRIKIIAQEKNIHFNTCWKQLLLERFLARLAGSSYSNKFIFKGGFLLSYLMKIGRETTDLDFLLTRTKVEQNELKTIFDQILSIYSEDGFTISFDTIHQLKQPHMDYPGYRVVLNAAFGKIKDKIQVDIGIGDVVSAVSREIVLVQYSGKPFFESSISLLVYPIETIFSEKLETILSKGPSNSRMKDYHDLILLIRNKKMLNQDSLKDVIATTFSNRGTPFQFIEFDENSLHDIQKLWEAHCRNLGKIAQELGLPVDISSIISEINNYIVSIDAIANVENFSLN